jgi:PAS domain S-box-containing protein
MEGHRVLEGSGLWAEALRSRRAVIIEDYPRAPGRRGLPEGHVPLHRLLVAPIAREGRILALIGVGNKAGPYTDHDIQKVEHLGELSWDIVERKRTQGLLQESEERFASVFRWSPLATSLMRADSEIIVDANEAFETLFGYAPAEVIGRSALELGLFDDPVDRARLGELREGRSTHLAWEPRLRKRDGGVIASACAVEAVRIRGEAYLVAQVLDQTERRVAEDRLRETLAEKEILLRELYHRANNNMQVISALLDFQALAMEEPRLSRALSDTQDRIASLALVNRKLFEAQDLSHVNLREYIEDLLGLLASSNSSRNGRMRFETALDDVRILVDTAVPCGLILNELISNVFRHAYPDGADGILKLSLHQDADGLIRLGVSDRGVGLPKGFDVGRDGGVGLQSIVGLCSSQLKGRVVFDQSAGGLSCELSFMDNLYNARV